MENEIKKHLENKLNETQNEENVKEKILIKNPIFEEIQKNSEEEKVKEEKEEINNNNNFNKKLHTVNTRLFSLINSGEIIEQQNNEKKKFVNLFNSEENKNLNKKIELNNNENNDDDYRQKEQEEFDKLLIQLNDETKNKEKEELINKKI
ncbi:hypothetical protein Mgra_00003132 [Meloidogyne graminicola]|uniref:Uncharacterized protein n=1 Tax=Meloidogyne graminicola TaxID=189291 RepID=A0A8S9ZW84_9BILA|nr:hypothetical protein Mgra_00003132 [Meloidogyne graminicola]